MKGGGATEIAPVCTIRPACTGERNTQRRSGLASTMFLVLFVLLVLAFSREAYLPRNLKLVCNNASVLPIALGTLVLGERAVSLA